MYVYKAGSHKIMELGREFQTFSVCEEKLKEKKMDEESKLCYLNI